MEYKPRSEFTQEEAINTITRRELRTAKEVFGVSLINDISDESKLEECLWALVYTFEKRSNTAFTTELLDDFDLGTVLHYFTPTEATDGESELGKDSESTV